MSDFSPREVLIPLVGGTGGGALCRVGADGDLPAPHPAQLNRSISDLLECGLYQAGQQALAATRRLQLGRGLRREAVTALYVANPGDIGGLATENSSSAEFGLALARLLYVTQSQTRSALASGSLVVGDTDRDVGIGAIFHLKQKFDLVLDYFAQPGVAKPPTHFFVPALDPDGADIEERYESEIAALRAIGIKVVPVATLGEAASLAGATSLAGRPADYWLKRGAAVAAVITGVLALAAWVMTRPIDISFAARAMSDGGVLQTPVRLGAERRVLPMCVDGDGMPTFKSGDLLGFNIAESTSGWLGPNHYIAVTVSADSGSKVLSLPLAENGRLLGGYEIDIARGPTESNSIFILARRHWPFDAASLDRELRDQIAPLRASERISAARNYLSSQGQGMVEYLFKSTNDEFSCGVRSASER